MCTKPHPIAEKAYQAVFKLQSWATQGSFQEAQLEKEVVNALTATLLHGENCVGHIVSGGTEANLMALLAARNMAQVQSARSGFARISPFLVHKNLQPA